MARIETNSFCADLLARCAEHDPRLLARVAIAAGVALAKLEACREHAGRLSVDEQRAVADAIERRVPAVARDARRLRAQAEAAARFASSDLSAFASTGAPSGFRHSPSLRGRSRPRSD